MNTRLSHIPYPVLALFCLSLTACQNEKKIATYNALYAETPTTIYIAPVQDNTPRAKVESQGDRSRNQELDVAASYMYQTLAMPMLQQGYYVIPPLASKQIASCESRSQRQQLNGDLSSYDREFNIDAILYPTIHKWDKKDGGVVVYVEYILRSTKSSNDLMHVWVKGYKRNATNYKGEPIPLKSDNDFAIDMQLTDGEAQRCILLKQISHVVMHNLPTSANRRQFREDQYGPANPTHIFLFSNENGETETTPMPMEQYEVECFSDEL